MSTYVHDWQCCDCRGADGKFDPSVGIFVDGGLDYLRCGGNLKNIIDMSVTQTILTPCVECGYFQNSEQNVPYCYHDVKVNPPAMPVILYGIGSNDTFKDCPMKEDTD